MNSLVIDVLFGEKKRGNELTAQDERLLAKVVTAAFSQRRKMLRNTLRELVSAEQFAALGIDPMLRAEDMGVVDYVRIANFLSSGAGGDFQC